MTNAPRLTDRNALDLHRARALQTTEPFLHKEAAAELEERLALVNKSFAAPLIIGHASDPIHAVLPNAAVIEDSDRLQISPGAQDLVLHAFGLHWADDPIGQLVQSRLALQPDGFFLGVMFGGTTLQELRAVLAEAETMVTGGLSPRVLPMSDIRDLGGLLQRAGFALPVADGARLTVRYPDLATLVRDLRGMGESNALAQRHRKALSRDFFRIAEEIYRHQFSDNGYLVASFELMFLTGWAPDASQQQPLRPGSARTRLSEALGTSEIPLKRT